MYRIRNPRPAITLSRFLIIDPTYTILTLTARHSHLCKINNQALRSFNDRVLRSFNDRVHRSSSDRRQAHQFTRNRTRNLRPRGLRFRTSVSHPIPDFELGVA